MIPQTAFFPNSKSCQGFEAFISATIIDRVRNGSLLVWGKVNDVQPPYLVMPITVEPSGPRMCHDELFLNLWIRDLPFSLDYITSLPHYVFKSHYQTTFDDKSGYDHILYPQSFTFVRLQWKGWYFCYKTLPFGWKACANIYHTIGLAATNYIRLLGVPCSQYIDDQHVGQLGLRRDIQKSFGWPNFALAEATAFIVCCPCVPWRLHRSLKICRCSPDQNKIFGSLIRLSPSSLYYPRGQERQVCHPSSVYSPKLHSVHQDAPVFCRQDNFFLPCCSCRTVIRQRNISRHFPSSSLFSPY